MIYFRDTTDFYMAGPTAVTLGKFDGVHLGHQKLMHRILELSGEGSLSVVFALNAKREDLIFTEQEQRGIIEQMGMDCLVQCPFVPEIVQMSPLRFVEEILIGRLHAAQIVVGTDFRFGYRRAGDAAFLKQCEKTHGIRVIVVEKERYQGREISSTFVREALAEGKMELVSALLGRDFPIHGTVLHGAHLGSRLGMPTANLIPPPAKLLPPNGVYLTRTQVGDQTYFGVTNIGVKPTVDGSYKGVETYLLDFSGDLYGQSICVELLSHTRAEKRFGSLEELKEQIALDIAAGRKYFSRWEGERKTGGGKTR